MGDCCRESEASNQKQVECFVECDIPSSKAASISCLFSAMVSSSDPTKRMRTSPATALFASPLAFFSKITSPSENAQVTCWRTCRIPRIVRASVLVNCERVRHRVQRDGGRGEDIRKPCIARDGEKATQKEGDRSSCVRPSRTSVTSTANAMLMTAPFGACTGSGAYSSSATMKPRLAGSTGSFRRKYHRFVPGL